MLNAETSAASLFLLLEPRIPLGFKGIDRLGLIPAGAGTSSSSDLRTADEAVARLTHAGLACEKAKGQRLHILGGTRTFVARGIHGYERPFTILEEETGGFTAIVAGARPFRDEDVCAPTLAQAVEAILGIYRARGMLPADEELP